eukprot:SM000201S05940  [mRNA]  locus=s201:106313:116892:- [translate_table: standard]
MMTGVYNGSSPFQVSIPVNDKRFKSLPPTEALPRSEILGGYIFVCNNDTMQEDLKRQLFGLPQRYRDSVRAIMPGLPLGGGGGGGNEPPPPLNEPLGGHIFVSKSESMEQDVQRSIFGLPHRFLESVRRIQPGMPLFLYNYTTRNLHGVFEVSARLVPPLPPPPPISPEATSEGGFNLDPHAWDAPDKVDLVYGRAVSRYPSQVRIAATGLATAADRNLRLLAIATWPILSGRVVKLRIATMDAADVARRRRLAQVRFKVREERGRINEQVFRPLLYHYEGHKFRLELSRLEVRVGHPSPTPQLPPWPYFDRRPLLCCCAGSLTAAVHGCRCTWSPQTEGLLNLFNRAGEADGDWEPVRSRGNKAARSQRPAVAWGPAPTSSSMAPSQSPGGWGAGGGSRPAATPAAPPQPAVNGGGSYSGASHSESHLAPAAAAEKAAANGSVLHHESPMKVVAQPHRPVVKETTPNGPLLQAVPVVAANGLLRTTEETSSGNGQAQPPTASAARLPAATAARPLAVAWPAARSYSAILKAGIAGSEQARNGHQNVARPGPSTATAEAVALVAAAAPEEAAPAAPSSASSSDTSSAIGSSSSSPRSSATPASPAAAVAPAQPLPVDSSATVRPAVAVTVDRRPAGGPHVALAELPPQARHADADSHQGAAAEKDRGSPSGGGGGGPAEKSSEIQEDADLDVQPLATAAVLQQRPQSRSPPLKNGDPSGRPMPEQARRRPPELAEEVIESPRTASKPPAVSAEAVASVTMAAASTAALTSGAQHQPPSKVAWQGNDVAHLRRLAEPANPSPVFGSSSSSTGGVSNGCASVESSLPSSPSPPLLPAVAGLDNSVDGAASTMTAHGAASGTATMRQGGGAGGVGLPLPPPLTDAEALRLSARQASGPQRGTGASVSSGSQPLPRQRFGSGGQAAVPVRQPPAAQPAPGLRTHGEDGSSVGSGGNGGGLPVSRGSGRDHGALNQQPLPRPSHAPPPPPPPRLMEHLLPRQQSALAAAQQPLPPPMPASTLSRALTPHSAIAGRPPPAALQQQHLQLYSEPLQSAAPLRGMMPPSGRGGRGPLPLPSSSSLPSMAALALDGTGAATAASAHFPGARQMLGGPPDGSSSGGGGFAALPSLPLGPPAAPLPPAAFGGGSSGVGGVFQQPPTMLMVQSRLGALPTFMLPPVHLLRGINELHDEILEFSTVARPSAVARRRAEAAVEQVRLCVQELWPGADIEVFGSYATGLALPHSDVDVAVVQAPPPPMSAEGAYLQGPRTFAPLIRQLSASLQGRDWCESLVTIETASIPVVKLRCRVLPKADAASPRTAEAVASAAEDAEDAVTSIVAIDITISGSRLAEVSDSSGDPAAIAEWNNKLRAAQGAHNGAAAREYIIERLHQMPALGPLVLLNKAYLHHRGLNDVYKGGLGSFSLTLMLIYFLERVRLSCGTPSVRLQRDPLAASAEPPSSTADHHGEGTSGSSSSRDGSASAGTTAWLRAGFAADMRDDLQSIPSPNVGVLLLSFLHIFGGELDFSQLRLVLKVSTCQTPAAGLHRRALAPAGPQSQRDPGGLFLADPQARPAALWIDNPLRPGSNIGAGSFAMWHVQAAWRDMLHCLASLSLGGLELKDAAVAAKASSWLGRRRGGPLPLLDHVFTHTATPATSTAASAASYTPRSGGGGDGNSDSGGLSAASSLKGLH